MKQIKKFLPQAISAILILNSLTTTAQTQNDTVKTGKTGDPMVVNPGKVADSMVVKPPKPNDPNAVLTDTGFINKSIIDNLMEIELAILGRDKGQSKQVKEIAASIIADHTTILSDLRKLAAKKQIALSKTEKPALPQTNMKPSDDFDPVWGSQMLTKHEAKIAELERFLTVTQDADIKAAISKALPKVRMHRDMLAKIPGAKAEEPNTVIH